MLHLKESQGCVRDRHKPGRVRLDNGQMETTHDESGHVPMSLKDGHNSMRCEALDEAIGSTRGGLGTELRVALFRRLDAAGAHQGSTIEVDVMMM